MYLDGYLIRTSIQSNKIPSVGVHKLGFCKYSSVKYLGFISFVWGVSGGFVLRTQKNQRWLWGIQISSSDSNNIRIRSGWASWKVTAVKLRFVHAIYFSSLVYTAIKKLKKALRQLCPSQLQRITFISISIRVMVQKSQIKMTHSDIQ